MKIPSVNCGKVVGKAEENLQNGDEILTKFRRQSIGKLPTESPSVFC